MKAPYRPYDEIRRISDEFLATYHLRLDLPVPIEMIVEQNLGLDIIPVRGLRYTQGRDGYLRLDRTGIVVDDHLFDPRYITRYNFTLAHEVGHFVMHSEVYEAISHLLLHEWYDLHLRQEVGDVWFERQADDFAGLILVPTTHLLGPNLDAAIEAVGLKSLAYQGRAARAGKRVQIGVFVALR